MEWNDLCTIVLYVKCEESTTFGVFLFTLLFFFFGGTAVSFEYVYVFRFVCSFRHFFFYVILCFPLCYYCCDAAADTREFSLEWSCFCFLRKKNILIISDSFALFRNKIARSCLRSHPVSVVCVLRKLWCDGNRDVVPCAHKLMDTISFFLFIHSLQLLLLLFCRMTYWIQNETIFAWCEHKHTQKKRKTFSNCCKCVGGKYLREREACGCVKETTDWV